MPPPDLLEGAKRGDPQCVESLLLRHLPALRAFVRLRTGARIRAKESCSDLVQSVCREVLGDIRSFRGSTDAQFRQWLYSTALHKIEDRARYWHVRRRVETTRASPASAASAASTESTDSLLLSYSSICTPSQEAATAEEIERIEAAFDQLPEDYREVITLARIVGLSHREVAERLGRSETAVRQLLTRARARLAMLLDLERKE